MKLKYSFRLIIPSLLFLSIISLSPLYATAAAQQRVVFTHATLIDMTSAKTKPDMTIVIEGNRIAAVGASGKVHVPKNARIVDAGGKFLIPGLWDMHAHSIGEKGTREIFFPLMIANGITGVRDMFADCYPDCSQDGGLQVSLPQVNEWRKTYAAGTRVAPRIVASSPLVIGPKGGYKGALIVRDADEAREAVRYIKRRGNDFIKVDSFLSRDAYFAVADEAKKRNLIFAGHISNSVTATEASDAGQKSTEHLTGILLACSTDEERLRRELVASEEGGRATMSGREINKRLLETYSDVKAAALFARFVRNDTWACPTLTAARGTAFLDDKKFTADARLKFLPLVLREAWKPAGDLTAEDFAEAKERFEKRIEIVGAMHRAGIPILAGTDAPNPFCFPGFSLHDELALFVRAGMTPLEALQTATVNPAKYLNLTGSLGTIETGKLADLVLLDANPLDDIGNTRRIAAVVFNGRFLSKEAREKMLADVQAIANKN